VLGSDSLSRDVAEDAGAALDGRLQQMVEMVVSAVAGCDWAGVSINVGGTVRTAAASDELVCRSDQWQYDLGEGPCLDTMRTGQTVISQDLRGEDRWPRWGPWAVDALGMRGVLAVFVDSDHGAASVLNLYARRPGSWTQQSTSLATVLASRLADVANDAHRIEHLTRAMDTRAVIGQAVGIVMERYGLDADRAFAYLRRLSQDGNRKLFAIAADIAGNP
jgi:hypothetical protein